MTRKKGGAKAVHWAEKIADEVISSNKKDKILVCGAGITPSGLVHIGNFRDLITSDCIFRLLKDGKKKASLLFSWDDYDRFRKIPEGVAKSFSDFIGLPVSKVPDPYKCHKSYAEHFEKGFEEGIKQLGIMPKIIYQTKEYEKNKYYKEIILAMQKRKEIAKILSDFKTQKMSDEQIENYYPLQVYCEKCGKDNTEITEYDGKNKVSYSCKCGHKKTEDISKKNIGKLAWKVDWAMKWAHYKIAFEPGGKDHATHGGSYDISKKIAEEIFKTKAPIFQGYEFVGVRGTSKMSSSAGTGISPKELLKIYEPELLRWLFTRANPKRTITFCFDSELIRQYDESDNELRFYFSKKLPADRRKSLELAKIKHKKEFSRKTVPFKQVVMLGQVAQGNFFELKNMLKRIGQDFDESTLKQRLEKAQNWVELYAKQLQIKLRTVVNHDYYKKLIQEEKNQIKELSKGIEKNWNLESLTALVYSIPKKEGLGEDEIKKRQRNFFKNSYQMLIDADTGPRLPTFLLAIGKEKAKKLLTV